MNYPLEGLKVIELARILAGPWAGQTLSDLGAEVIKVESLNGDDTRQWGPPFVQNDDDNSASYFHSCNRGKKSICVDLKTLEGQKIIKDLVSESDILIENFKVGGLSKYGLDFENLIKVNPKLIYCSITGFGQTGPMSKKPAMDPVLQAFTGFMSENKGSDGHPHRTPVIIFDMTTALYAMQLISSTLYARINEDVGRKIEISLMEAAAAMQSIRLMSGYMDGPYTHASSPSGTFKTMDGWIQIIVVKNHEFIKFCNAVGWKDFLNDERFSSNAKRIGLEKLLTEEVQKLFINKKTDYWKKLLTEAGVQNEKVQDYSEFVNSEQIKILETISWLKQPTSDAIWPIPNLPGMPKLVNGSYLSIAPALGQHSREIMLDNGYDIKIIIQLIEEGVII